MKYPQRGNGKDQGRWAGRKTGSRKPKPPEEMPYCLHKWRDKHGIWRVCHRKKGHSTIGGHRQ